MEGGGGGGEEEIRAYDNFFHCSDKLSEDSNFDLRIEPTCLCNYDC